MTKIIGIDPGDKRIGVAVADLDTRMITPITTLNNSRSFFNELKALQTEYDAKKLIVGMPITSAGLHGEQAKKVLELVEKIKKHLSIEIHFEDERHTSKVAQIHLRTIGQDKSEIDAFAAVLILKSWLGRQKT